MTDILRIVPRPPPGFVWDLLYSRVAPGWNIDRATLRKRDDPRWPPTGRRR